MQVPIEISGKGYTVTPAQEDLIRRAVERLERFSDRVIGCRVVVTVPHRYTTGEPVAWAIRLVLTLPQGGLAVSRETGPSFREALDAAFAAARRQLQDFVRQLRGDVKRHESPNRALVTRLFPYEGYGFLTDDAGRQIYFHRNAVRDGGFEGLAEGTEVQFTEEEGELGLQASVVVPLVSAAPPPG